MKFLNNFSYHLYGVCIMLVVYVLIGFRFVVQKIQQPKVR